MRALRHFLVTQELDERRDLVTAIQPATQAPAAAGITHLDLLSATIKMPPSSCRSAVYLGRGRGGGPDSTRPSRSKRALWQAHQITDSPANTGRCNLRGCIWRQRPGLAARRSGAPGPACHSPEQSQNAASPTWPLARASGGSDRVGPARGQRFEVTKHRVQNAGQPSRATQPQKDVQKTSSCRFGIRCVAVHRWRARGAARNWSIFAILISSQGGVAGSTLRSLKTDSAGWNTPDACHNHCSRQR